MVKSPFDCTLNISAMFSKPTDLSLDPKISTSSSLLLENVIDSEENSSSEEERYSPQNTSFFSDTETSDFSSEFEEPHKAPNIGSDYQAQVQRLLTEAEKIQYMKETENSGTLVWNPDGLADTDVDDYLAQIHILYGRKNLVCEEKALHLLHTNNYDPQLALAAIHKGKSDVKKETWTVEEKLLFEMGFARCRNDVRFQTIQKLVLVSGKFYEYCLFL